MSCAGDQDVGLQTFGLEKDGCKDVSEEQSTRYSMELSHLVLKSQHVDLNVTQICRCSWNGCNGMIGTGKENVMPHNHSSNNKGTILTQKLLQLYPIIILIRATKI